MNALEHYYKTFVSVGNAKQYFTRLLSLVDDIAEQLPAPVLIQRGHTPFSSTKADVVDFVQMDTFIKHVNNADILILHAGAGSTLLSIRAGKCPILVPRRKQYMEHINDHQVAFATALKNEGKAQLAETAEEIINAIKNDSLMSKLQRADNLNLDKLRNRINLVMREC